MQHWKLTLRERVFLLKLWILPALVYPSRVIYPVKQVVDSLKVIYHIALGLSTWGLTHEALALPEQEGGMGLAMPRDFLLWHHSALFVQGTVQPHTVPPRIREDFDRWSMPRGIAVSPSTLPFFQMDVNIPWEALPYMAFSAKAFSVLRQQLNISIPSELPYDMPLWHNPIFHNKHFHSYSCPSLIRCGVLTVGQLLEDDSNLSFIAPTRRAVYRDAVGQLATGMYEFDAQATHPAVCFFYTACRVACRQGPSGPHVSKGDKMTAGCIGVGSPCKIPTTGSRQRLREGCPLA